MDMIRVKDEVEAAVLKAIIGILPPGPFTFAGLERAMGGAVAGAELQYALWQLHKSDRVRGYRKLSGEPLYLLPLDQQMLLAPQLAGLPAPVEGNAETVILDRRHSGEDIVMNLIAFLKRIAVCPVKLSGKSVLPKRIIDDWSRVVSLSSDAVQPAIKRGKSSVALPPAIALLLELALRTGLVKWQAGTISVDEQRLLAWLTLPDADMRRELHRCYLPAFLPREPLGRMVAIALPAIAQGQWISTGNVKHWWEAITTDVPKESLPGCLIEPLIEELHVLRELGWVETGLTEQGETVFRTRFHTEIRAEPIYIQPDGELLLSSGQAYRLHYQLQEFAPLVRKDRLYVYALTRESFASALSQGWQPNQIIAFLQANSASGIPEQMSDRIKEWTGTFARIRMEPVTAIRFADQETADTMTSFSALAAILTPENRLNATAFIVDQQTDRQVRDIFHELGLVVMPPSKSSDAEPVGKRLAVPGESHGRSESSMAKRKSAGLFPSLFSTDAYASAEPCQQATSLYPGVESVPAAWFSELRAYHRSTVRTMIEHALLWKCKMQIEYNGTTLVFSPDRFSEDYTAVASTGSGMPSLIRLTDMKRIRLILPGISNS